MSGRSVPPLERWGYTQSQIRTWIRTARSGTRPASVVTYSAACDGARLPSTGRTCSDQPESRQVSSCRGTGFGARQRSRLCLPTCTSSSMRLWSGSMRQSQVSRPGSALESPAAGDRLHRLLSLRPRALWLMGSPGRRRQCAASGAQPCLLHRTCVSLTGSDGREQLLRRVSLIDKPIGAGGKRRAAGF